MTTLPTPTLQPIGREWDGKPRRAREFHYDLGPAEDSTGRRVLSVAYSHWASSKSFAAFAVVKTLSADGSEGYFPLSGVAFAQERVGRYSEKALEAYVAAVADKLPALIEQHEKVRDVFAPLLAAAPQAEVFTPEELAAQSRDPREAITYMPDRKLPHLVQPQCTCGTSIFSGFSTRSVATNVAERHLADDHATAMEPSEVALDEAAVAALTPDFLATV